MKLTDIKLGMKVFFWSKPDGERCQHKICGIVVLIHPTNIKVELADGTIEIVYPEDIQEEA